MSVTDARAPHSDASGFGRTGTEIPIRGLKLPPPEPPRFSLTLKIFSAAALLILILGAAVYFAFDPSVGIVIGLIGCLEGFQTQGTAQSVGERTTSSVVQTISLVILLDALAALFFMEMDW